ncbi:MAG: hypothetical protein PVJ73_07200 [Acidobacteriota bacterium]|jgi:hypothetical protein
MAARRFWKAALLLGVLGLFSISGRARATVDMQNEARALGYPVENCLYCHATPHAVEKMKEKARETDMSEGNCLLCHGAEIPAALNHRGQWLVEERARRNADEADMSWLEGYEEPESPEEPAPTKPPTKPAAPEK